MQLLIILCSAVVTAWVFTRDSVQSSIKEGFNLAAKSFGFHDIESLSSYILIITNKLTTLAVLLTSFTLSLFGFIEDWIFAPIYTYAVFMILMTSEAVLGTFKALYFDKEKFNWDKFLRIIPKFLAHTFALSTAFHMAKAEELFSWMPSTIFIFFGIQNFMKSIMHLVDMKVLDGSFANFMRKKFSQNNEITHRDYEDESERD